MKTIIFNTHALLIAACMLTASSSVFASNTLPQEGEVLVYASDPTQGFIFSQEQVKHRFSADFLRWAVEDVGQLPKKDKILFVGSSSMRMWDSIHEDLAPLQVIHRGFGGSTMKDVVAFQDFFARYQAHQIVVYEGDNDINPDAASVDRFIENCKTFIAYMRERQPDVVNHFLSPKPSPVRWSGHALYEDARQKLQALVADDPKLHYIDITTPMLNEAGEPKADIFKRDRLHMNEAGYDLWEAAVRAHFDLPRAKPRLLTHKPESPMKDLIATSASRPLNDKLPTDLADGDVLFYAEDPAEQFRFNKEQAKHYNAGIFLDWASQDLGTLPRQIDVLLIGNGTFAKWETLDSTLAPLKTLTRANRVFKLGTVEDFKNFFTRYQAPRIVLYFGENDLNEHDYTQRNFIRYIKEFHAYIQNVQPGTEILVLSPKPSPRRWKHFEVYRKVGQEIQTLAAATEGLTYVDITPAFLGDNGEPDPACFQKNRQTPSETGYARLAPLLREALGLPAN